MSGNFREFHNFKFHKNFKKIQKSKFQKFPKKYPKFCVFLFENMFENRKISEKNRISQVLKIVDFLLENLSRKKW